MFMKNNKTWIFCCVAVGCFLVACQPEKKAEKSEEKPAVITEKPVEKSNLQLLGQAEKLDLDLPVCQEQNCPKLSIYRLNSNQIFIDEFIDQQILLLLKQTLNVEIPDGMEQKTASSEPKNLENLLSPKQKLEQGVLPYKTDFIALDQEAKALSANHQISFSISPKILNSEGNLVTVVLNSNHYLGGAHGSVSQQYFNFDLEKKKLVPLQELVEQNQLAQLEKKAHTVFEKWVIDTLLAENVKEYEQVWPFKLPKNYYLGRNGLILQYGEYEIGPYVVGLPRLVIPYDDLKGILKEKYLVKNNMKSDISSSSEVLAE